MGKYEFKILVEYFGTINPKIVGYCQGIFDRKKSEIQHENQSETYRNLLMNLMYNSDAESHKSLS